MKVEVVTPEEYMGDGHRRPELAAAGMVTRAGTPGNVR
jgi:hypothetical protein